MILLVTILFGICKRFCRTTLGVEKRVEPDLPLFPAADLSSKFVIAQSEIGNDALCLALCHDPQTINACKDANRLRA